MRSLYLRIYATVVVVLLLFAAASGWVVQRHLEQERARAETVLTERMGAWADLIQRSLPAADAPAVDQAGALHEWSQRLRLPLALDNADGTRVAASESFLRRSAEGQWRTLSVHLEDGRTLWLMRPMFAGQGGVRPGGPGLPPPPREVALPRAVPPEASGAEGGAGTPARPGARPGGAAVAEADRVATGDGFGGGREAGEGGAPPGARPLPPGLRPEVPWIPFLPPGLPRGLGLVAVLVVLFIAVSAGAFPVVRRLTRRLESLKRGVETFGGGQLQHRVAISGNDEVAAVARSFNVAAERIEALVRSHQSLLANASHELRSPLARMKMAVSLLADAPPDQRGRLQREIDTNIAELDALVEEVLLASRLDAAKSIESTPVDLLGLAAEEAARVDAGIDGAPLTVSGDERLLRRALRNLLENARRYGGADVSAVLQDTGANAEVRVCDRGPGVPEAMRERIFEPFFRLPGHAEQAGGVGLGLSLVKQIAERHGGSVRCEAREGGGSCFVLSLPRA